MTKILMNTALALLLGVGMSAVAQDTSTTQSGAKQDMKDAGSDTKSAAKNAASGTKKNEKAAHATKKGTQKVVHSPPKRQAKLQIRFKIKRSNRRTRVTTQEATLAPRVAFLWMPSVFNCLGVKASSESGSSRCSPQFAPKLRCSDSSIMHFVRLRHPQNPWSVTWQDMAHPEKPVRVY